MPKYLINASYTTEGARGLLKDGGTVRRKAVEDMVRQLDGSIEAFYYGYGNPDVYVIVDLPNQTSAIAVSLIVNSSGAVTLSTTPLISPEEVDAACQRTIAYRPPGG